MEVLQQGGGGVPVPRVAIAPHALDWDGAKKSRTVWPFPKKVLKDACIARVGVDGFFGYMVPLREKSD
eukprot:5506370-Pyramimonas_sp.AAC.1